MAVGVMATTAPWASASVLVRMTVMRPLPWSQVSAAASLCLNRRRTGPPPGRDRSERARRPARGFLPHDCGDGVGRR